MPTLEQQLENNRKEEIEFQLANPKLERLESFISGAAVIAGFLSFFIAVAIGYLIFGFLIPKKSEWGGILGIVYFYGGIYLAVVGQAWIEKPLQKLVHFFFGISEAKYEKNISTRSNIRSRKWDIEKQIRDRDAKIQREIKEEQERKLREIYKERERVFIAKLNNAVYDVLRLSYENATTLYKQLLDEYASIKYLHYHSNVYYRNRFIKITSAINGNTNPILRTRTTKLATNNAEQPITDKPSIKTESPIIKINPVINSSESKVEPFSPTYKPIVIPEPLVDSKPINKTEPSNIAPTAKTENFKPLVKPEKIHEQDKTIEELLENKKKAEPKSTSLTSERVPVKIDYAKLNVTRIETGRLGELCAIKFEKKRLDELGLYSYKSKIEHSSLKDDTLGYDFISYNQDSSKRYIEVKSTTDVFDAPFIISENEREAIYGTFNYFIYRVYNLNTITGDGNVTIIDGHTDIDKYYSVTPYSYKVSPK